MFIPSLLILYALIGVWAQSQAIPLVFHLLVVGVLGVAGYFKLEEKPFRFLKIKLFFLPFFSLVPALIYWALNLKQEFPFGCDYGFHSGALLDLAAFWKKALLPFCFLSFIYLRFHKRFFFSHAFFYIALQILGFYFTLPLSGVRYPALSYFLGGPWAVLVQLIDANLFQANRLNSLSSILFWAVFRQAFWKKVSPIQTLFFIFAFFFQRESVFYFNYSYLEPWGIVFALLAFEALLNENKNENLSLFFVAAASVSKEYCVFLYPFIFVSLLLLEPKHWKRVLIKTGLSALPFLSFVILRSKFQVDRGLVLTFFPWRENPAFWEGYGRELFGQYGIGGIALFIVFLLFFIRELYSLKDFSSLGRASLFGLMPAFSGVFFFFLFFFDTVLSKGSPGCSRFNLLPWALLCLSFSYLAAKRITKRQAPYFLVLVLILNLTTLVPFLTNWARPSYLMNEGAYLTERPNFFPIREMIEKAEKNHLLKPGAVIHLQLQDSDTKHFAPNFTFGYRELRRFSLVHKEFIPCTCTGQADAFFSSISYEENLKGLASFQEEQRRIQECLNNLKTTCKHVEEVRSPSGELISVLGIKN